MPMFVNLLLFALGAVSPVARANLCHQFRTLPEPGPCNCTIDGQVWCSDFRLEQSCLNRNDHTLLCINCDGGNLNTNLTMPFGVDFSAIRKLEVYSCLVNAPLKDTLDKIGIRDVRAVQFYDGTRFEHQLPLSGLNLTKVKIYAENITLSDNDLLPDSEQLEEFYLQGSSISVIPNNFLANKPFVKQIFIANNSKLSDLPEIFAIPSLHKLHLQQNNIARITSTVFSVLRNLTVLDLKANPIKWVAEDAFRNNRALICLHLRFDDGQLPEHVFEPLESLTELRIVGGRLQIIQEQLFRNQSRLTILDLSDNQLAQLKGPIFANLNVLEDLELAKNQLQSITKEIFPKLNKLKKINLNGNMFTDISSNPESISPFDRLNLSELSLESNQLSNIGLWADKSSLKVLKMSKNLLTSLDVSVIPETLRELDLSYNSIQHVHVSDETLNSNQLQLKLILKGNSLSYDCRLMNFVRLVLRQRDLRVIPSIGIEQLNEEQLFCDLEQPLCPKECHSCRLFGPQRQLIMNCSHKALEAIPRIPTELHLNASSVVLDVRNNCIRLLPKLESNPGFGLVNSLLMDNNLFESWSVANLHDNLTSISLINNTLQNLDMKLVDAIMALPELKQIHLHGNHWPCHCALANRMLLLQSKISNFNTLTCGDSGRLLSTIEQSCENQMFALTSISFLTLMLIAVGFAIYYRYQRAIKTWLFVNHQCLSCVSEVEADAHFKYDAFISYSHHDEDFVASELVPALEAAPQKFQLCIHVRDFIVGMPIQSQIIQAITNSRRTIVYVTKHFLQSEWTRHEFRLAFDQSLRENRTRLIVILASDVSKRLDELDPQLRMFFSTTTYLRKDDVAFWRKLLYAMPRRDVVTMKQERKAQKEEHRWRNSSLREVNLKREQKDVADVKL
ncbi:protein toll-like [Ochlerotatus camptorhynchus]|uniref:protein toll-like n=1 Tax=Ochlerotatus camptorhynchus TaxID=644619 RepID=UPI0031E32BDC